MATIGIICRNNDLFEVLVPKVVKALREGGKDVETLVIPKGTDWDEMCLTLESWQEQKKKEGPKGYRVLSDLTCADILAGKYGAGGHLDYLVGDAMAAAFLQVSPAQLTERFREVNSLEKTKELFQRAVRAVSEKIGAPMSVTIVADHLKDHFPFHSMQNEDAKAILQAWMIEVFPHCTFGDDGDQHQATWEIIDRHMPATRKYEEAKSDQGAFLRFCLPVETMIGNLGELGLLPPADITEQMVRELVRHWV